MLLCLGLKGHSPEVRTYIDIIIHIILQYLSLIGSNTKVSCNIPCLQIKFGTLK